MLFLIDYENVSYSGLRGVELLSQQDNLTIFYSQSSRKIERDTFQKIIATHCSFDIQKLKAPGKNALDFMIITHIHSLFNNGGNDPIIIVSKDKGYNVVRQYWEARGKKIYIRPNIFAGIVASNEQSERFIIAQSMLEKVDLELEFKMQKRREYERKRLSEIIGDCTEQLDSLISFLEGNPKPKEKYLHMLKTYGRATGLCLYREIKLLCFESDAAS